MPIHQLGVHEDGRCFFSMKMVKGRSLADILKSDKRGVVVTTVQKFSEAVNALQQRDNVIVFATLSR